MNVRCYGVLEWHCYLTYANVQIITEQRGIETGWTRNDDFARK